MLAPGGCRDAVLAEAALESRELPAASIPLILLCCPPNPLSNYFSCPGWPEPCRFWWRTETYLFSINLSSPCFLLKVNRALTGRRWPSWKSAELKMCRRGGRGMRAAGNANCFPPQTLPLSPQRFLREIRLSGTLLKLLCRDSKGWTEVTHKACWRNSRTTYCYYPNGMQFLEHLGAPDVDWDQMS